mmetsp:Transcript_19912/g.47145  ORF Transcript_19912/g.47145 Transcript_19912/m.47145 type:complete len:251 (+) Transcript_19912:236-988(+)
MRRYATLRQGFHAAAACTRALLNSFLSPSAMRLCLRSHLRISPSDSTSTSGRASALTRNVSTVASPMPLIFRSELRTSEDATAAKSGVASTQYLASSCSASCLLWPRRFGRISSSSALACSTIDAGVTWSAQASFTSSSRVLASLTEIWARSRVSSRQQNWCMESTLPSARRPSGDQRHPPRFFMASMSGARSVSCLRRSQRALSMLFSMVANGKVCASSPTKSSAVGALLRLAAALAASLLRFDIATLL